MEMLDTIALSTEVDGELESQAAEKVGPSALLLYIPIYSTFGTKLS